MKSKKIILFSVLALLAVLLAFFLITDFFGLNINLIKHHSFEIEKYSVSFYGSISEVRVVKIYDGSKKIASLPFESTPENFEKANTLDPELIDLTGDGHKDLILPHSFDHNDSRRYAAFIYDSEKNTFVASEALSDIANFTIDSETDTITSKMEIYTQIVPEQENAPEIYEKRKSLSEYKLIDGNFVKWSEKTLTYYSDNDIFCYSIYEYNEQTKEFSYIDEKWLSPDEAEKYIIY